MWWIVQLLHIWQYVFVILSIWICFDIWTILLRSSWDNIRVFSNQKLFKASDAIDSLTLKADPQTTTPNNCTCTSICRCAVDYADCDPGNPISWWPKLNTAIGEFETGAIQVSSLHLDNFMVENMKHNHLPCHYLVIWIIIWLSIITGYSTLPC